jgi:hypothetical protein
MEDGSAIVMPPEWNQKPHWEVRFDNQFTTNKNARIGAPEAEDRPRIISKSVCAAFKAFVHSEIKIAADWSYDKHQKARATARQEERDRIVKMCKGMKKPVRSENCSCHDNPPCSGCAEMTVEEIAWLDSNNSTLDRIIRSINNN